MLFFSDGTKTEKVTIDYPVGHRRRREEGIPLLEDKFERAVKSQFGARQAGAIIDTMRDAEALAEMDVHEFSGLWSLI